MDINSVTPTDFFELIITFTNGEIKVFSPLKAILYDQYGFLAYPYKFKAFRCTGRAIIWFNGQSFESDFIYKNSDEIATQLLIGKGLTIGSVNRAPTNQHLSHHMYSFLIYPFKREQEFALCESIGGGHAEAGGCAFYSLKELIESPNYAMHLKLAGCAWVVEILTGGGSDSRSVLNDIIADVCKRAYALNIINGR